MFLCGFALEIGGGVVGAGRGCPPRNDIRRREGRAGRDKYKYVTIIGRA